MHRHTPGTPESKTETPRVRRSTGSSGRGGGGVPAGAEEMGAAPEVARVRREKLSACLTCPLCWGLLREATAIAECLHTFCRECIMKEIDDEDADRCPVCNIDLGCDPEEKLRPDNNIQDIRNKLFPIKREKVASLKGPILPAKRKQRSLSSLVVETPRVDVKAGLKGKRTKATRRRTSYATSPDKNETMKVSPKPESQDQTIEKHTVQQSTKVVTTANKKQGDAYVDALKKPSSEDRKNGKTTDKEELQKPLNSSVDATIRMKSPRSTPKIQAVKEQLINNKDGELHIKKEGTEIGTRVRTHSNKSRLREENKDSSSKPAPLKEKTRTKDHLKQKSLGSAGINALHGAVTTPVWFSLVAMTNQKEDPQLPQLSKNYLRIKDGSLKVSSVQRYIMTKLDLTNEEEVEITCHGEPVSPSSTLQGLIDLCVRRETGKPIEASLDAPAKEFVMVLGYRRRRQLAPAP